MKTITYHYRGNIEVPHMDFRRGYRWTSGYSENSARGIIYPWMPRWECRKDAEQRGCKARFEGLP